MRCLELISLTILTTTVVAWSQAPGTASACARCHSAQTIHQPQTPMGRAMLLPGDNPVFKSSPALTVRKGAFTYAIETHGSATNYIVSDGSRSISLPIRWTFGLRMQTWVLEQDGHYYESMVSYYPIVKGLQTTVGDDARDPHSLEDAIGRRLTDSEARQCFGCHSSNSVSDQQLTLSSLQPGVSCEHCHAGSNAHLLDSAQGIFDSAPRNLKRLSSEEILNFCGQCHRTWETVVREGVHGVSNVRFQPYRLANSKCFDGADSRISCIACHDPHQDVQRDASTYDSKCLACHSGRDSGQPVAQKMVGKSCPTATANCTNCHMPKVKVNSPAGLLTFTDHMIRRAVAGEPYPN